MNTITVPSVDVLRNRGFQVKVHVVDTDEHGVYTRHYAEDDQPVFEYIWLRFNNWLIANMESPQPKGFGSLGGWEAELNERPTSAVLKTFALVEDRYVTDFDGQTLPDIRYASERLVDNQVMLYGLALTNAMFLANGIEPETVGEVLKRSLKEVADSIQERNDKAHTALADILETIPTSPSESLTSKQSSDSGQEQDEVLTSSGA